MEVVKVMNESSFDDLEKDGERKIVVCMPGRKAFGYIPDKRNQMVFADV